MHTYARSIALAVVIAAAIQTLTVGILAPVLPRELCRPMVRTDRTLTVPATRELKLKNDDGSIRINTHDAQNFHIYADIRAYTPTKETREKAQEYIFNLIHYEQHGQTTYLISEPEDRPDVIDLRVDYVIQVPKGTDLDLRGLNGNVWVARDVGNVHVESNNADVEINEPFGTVVAQSMNGRIRVYGAHSDTILTTINGNIYAHMTGGSLRANTTNGSIVTRLLDAGVHECILTAQNGGITLALAEDVFAEFDAQTQRGIVSSDFDIQPIKGENKRKHLRGVIGRGDTQITMTSMNGNIWITQHYMSEADIQSTQREGIIPLQRYVNATR